MFQTWIILETIHSSAFNAFRNYASWESDEAIISNQAAMCDVRNHVCFNIWLQICSLVGGGVV